MTCAKHQVAIGRWGDLLEWVSMSALIGITSEREADDGSEHAKGSWGAPD